jgi:hypothetical protein
MGLPRDFKETIRLRATRWIDLAGVLACGVTLNIGFSQREEAVGLAAAHRAESSQAGWVTYSDPQGRFRFSYPPAFGEVGRGTNEGFGNRVAAIRFSRFSSGSQDGQILLGGEAVLTRGPVMLDVQAAGGLYDSISLEMFPAPIRNSIVGSLPPLTAPNLCGELAREQHVDIAQPSLAALTPQQKDAVVRLDGMRNGNPKVLRCGVAGDTVTFHKEVTAQFGQASSRQHIYGAVRFLKAPFSSFQLILAGGTAPTPETLATMTSVVQSFEPR